MTLESTQLLLEDALESPRCVCGKTKKMRHPFCYDCFTIIPVSARPFLRNIDSNTYEAALDFLERAKENASKS